jgi:sulfur-oxidizing protein SoxZ
MATTRIKATLKEEITEVKVMIQGYTVESGLRKDSEDNLIPAHFIEEITFEYQGKVLLSGEWSGGISNNPFFSFKFKGGTVGEKVKVSWKDNAGEKDSVEADITE